MKILCKYPSYGRPALFKETLSRFQRTISGKHEVFFYITANINDPSMNNENIKTYMNSWGNVSYVYDDYVSKIEACNAEALSNNYDILVLISDDMSPKLAGWDDIITQDMQKAFPSLYGALCYYDGYAKNLMTLPVMGRPLIQKLGYIYHPSYKSFYCDNELTLMLKDAKLLKMIDTVVIKHDYQKGGTDAVYKMNSIKGGGDKKTFELRKAKGFDLCLLAS